MFMAHSGAFSISKSTSYSLRCPEVCSSSVLFYCLVPRQVQTGLSQGSGSLQRSSTSFNRDTCSHARYAWLVNRLNRLEFSLWLRFSFAAHTNAVPVASTLKHADGASIWRVSLYSAAWQHLCESVGFRAQAWPAMAGYDDILDYLRDQEFGHSTAFQRMLLLVKTGIGS